MEGKNHTALFIDDDTLLREMYLVKFKERGLSTIACGSAPEALRILEDGATPDIIVLDMVMPTMDGLMFLEALEKKHLAPQAVRIILSNQNDAPDIEKARALGISGYILKADTIPSQVVDEVIAITQRVLSTRATAEKRKQTEVQRKSRG